MELAQDRARGDAGFSLIEIVIALGLFSLVSLAGVMLVSSILQVRERTEGRLEELGNLQRGLLMIASDVQQARGGSVSVAASSASFQHGGESGALAVKYVAADGKLFRILSGNDAIGVQQTLLDRVTAVRWRLLLNDGGWVDRWPVPILESQDAVARRTPIALAVELDLDESRLGVSGTLRRIVELAAAQ